MPGFVFDTSSTVCAIVRMASFNARTVSSINDFQMIFPDKLASIRDFSATIVHPAVSLRRLINKFVVHPILFTPFALPRYCGMPYPSAPVDGLFDPRQADAADSFHFPVELFASARVTRIATMRLTTGSPTGPPTGPPTGSPVSADVVHARPSAGKPIMSYLGRQRARLRPKTRQRALARRRHDAQSYKTLTRRRFRSFPRSRTRTRSAGRLTVLRAAAAGRSLRPTFKPGTDRQRVSARDGGPSIRPTNPSRTRPRRKPRQPASHRVAGARCPQRRHSESCPSRGRSHAPSPTHSPQASRAGTPSLRRQSARRRGAGRAGRRSRVTSALRAALRPVRRAPRLPPASVHAAARTRPRPRRRRAGFSPRPCRLACVSCTRFPTARRLPAGRTGYRRGRARPHAALAYRTPNE